MKPALHVRNLTVAYDRKAVLENVSVDIPQDRLVAIVGPNGAGKSTLIKSVLGLVPIVTGYIEVFGDELKGAHRRIGYVPQRESVDWDFPVSVFDVVLMGTYGEVGWFRSPGKKQKDRAEQALESVGMSDYRNRQISQLSGGQQQRVFLARALAQDADIYFMDEPFAGVDAATERAIVEILRSLRTSGRTVVAVHHDLNTVPEFFDEVVLLNVRVIASGPIGEVFTPENLHETYGGKLGILERLDAEKIPC
jgi:manganese/zinc/iron transport system ATP- binding protein